MATLAKRSPCTARALGKAAAIRAASRRRPIEAHAEPFGNPRPIIDRLLGFYAKRQQKILDALEDAPLSAYDLKGKIFPKGNATDVYFMLSEVIANADVLEERGALTRAESGATWRYQRLRETI